MMPPSRAHNSVCTTVFRVERNCRPVSSARLKSKTHCWLFGDAAVAAAAAYYFIVRPHSFICTFRYFAVCLRIVWLQCERKPNVCIVHTQCAAHTHAHIHSTMKEMNDNERRRIESRRKKNTKSILMKSFFGLRT